MAIAYWTAAGITFFWIISAFLRDRAAPKADAKAWIFITVATLLWPVTLPFILRKKWQRTQANSAAQPPAPEPLQTTSTTPEP